MHTYIRTYIIRVLVIVFGGKHLLQGYRKPLLVFVSVSLVTALPSQNGIVLCVMCFNRKTVADTSEEEGPFLPRPAPTAPGAPYPYGSPAAYGPPGQDYVP